MNTDKIMSYVNYGMDFLSKNILVVSVSLFIVICVFYFLQKFNLLNKMTEKFTANNEGDVTNDVSTKPAELLLFYVDWCPHCKTAKPEWENLKAEIEGNKINGYNIMFTEYNCTTETDEINQLVNKYKIEGYPTIKLLKDDQVIEFDAKPTKDTLSQFLSTVL
jgi:thiol-disulfide isomerase/thioredoxin